MIYTGYSCSRQEKNTEMAAELPQITNKTELEIALSGTPKFYAVLNAPVSCLYIIRTVLEHRTAIHGNRPMISVSPCPRNLFFTMIFLST